MPLIKYFFDTKFDNTDVSKLQPTIKSDNNELTSNILARLLNQS